MIDNIKNYNIVTLEDFVAGVRQNPGMYIGAIGNRGVINMGREIIQNSLDEVEKEDSPATDVFIRFVESLLQFTVKDNGRGIPFGSIQRVFCDPHTSSNYQKKKGEYSSGLHGVGSKVTNALSEYFTVDSYILGEHRRMEFKKGHPVTEEYDDGTEIPKDAQGTIVQFAPDLDVLGVVTITVEDILALIEKILPITKIGTRIEFEGIKSDGTVIHRNLVNQDGMLTNLIEKTQTPLIAPIFIYRDTGEMKLEAVFTYDSNNLEDYNIDKFANFCPTIDGKHNKGFIDGICKYFKNYMNKVYLASNKKNKLTITNSDVLTGLQAIIHVCHIKPIFAGQAKDELANEDIYPFVRDTIVEELEKWSVLNSKDLQKLCKFFKDIAEVRVNAEKGKVKLISKYNADVLTGLPKKYIPANGKKGLELFIVEGDSAKGSTVNSRDARTQAIMPIRGKTPNPFTTPIQKLLSNEEIGGIITIMGAGYGKKFDIEKCKFDKIILAADRDPDGSHILVNLSSTFAILTPGLIEHGRLYKALPPLYGVRVGKKVKYFGTRMEYVEYLQSVFSKKNELIVNKKKLSNKEMSIMGYNNIDYIYDLEVMARNYALNPRFLESIIRYMHRPFDELQQILKSIYGRTIEIVKENGYIVISGLVENVVQTLFINDRFFNEADYIKNKYLYNENEEYILNGNKCLWLYDIMKAFNSISINVTRFKGLGEMNPIELGETTLNPENRLLVQYTFDSIKEDIEKLKEFATADGKKRLISNTMATRNDLLG